MPTTKQRFDRMSESVLEKLTSTDLNDLQDFAHEGLLEVIGELLGLGGATVPAQLVPYPTIPRARTIRGLRVGPTGPPSFDVVVGNGLGLAWVGFPAPSAGWSKTRLIYLPADATLTVDAPDALDRIDRVVALPALYYDDVDLRDIKDAGTGAYIPTLVNKRLRRVMRAGAPGPNVELYVLKGTPAAVPVPPVIAGNYWVPLAQVYVAAGAANIGAAAITDERIDSIIDATKPRVRCRVVGTAGAGFAFPGDVPAAEMVCTGGAGVTGASRAGAGVYTIDVSGLGSVTHQQATLIGAAGMISVDTLGFPVITVKTFNSAGAAADRDFFLSVESTPGEAAGYTGALY